MKFRRSSTASLPGRPAKASFAPLATAILTLAVGALVNLPHLDQVIATTVLGRFSYSPTAAGGIDDAVAIRAGWPLTYLRASVNPIGGAGPEVMPSRPAVVHLAAGGSDVSVRLIDRLPLRAVANAAIVLLIAAALAIITAFRGRAVASPRIWDTAALAIIALVLVSTAGSIVYRGRQHRAIAASLGQHGSVGLTARVPAVLASRIPRPLADAFFRVETVLLGEPSEAQLAKLETLPGLRHLTLTNHTLTARQCDRWADRRSLGVLRLVSCELTADSIQSLGRCGSLRHLELYRCEAPAGRSGELGGLPGLQSLTLYHSPLRWDEASPPPWTRSLRHLATTGPGRREEPAGTPPPDNEAAAAGSALTLADWPELQELEILAAPRINPRPLQVSLRRLPRLASVQLSRWRKISLTAEQLPSLQSIGEVPSISAGEFNAPVDLPAGLWVSDLRLRDLPQLTAVEFCANDLDRLELTRLPAVRRLSLARGFFNSEFERRRPGPSRLIDDDWLRQIASLETLQEIELIGLRLRNRDLTPLSGLGHLRELSLSGAGLDSEDLDFIHPMTELRTLQLFGCTLQNERFDRLLLDLPHLQTLEADLHDLQRLTLINRPAIQNLGRLELPHARQVRLTGVPRLGGMLWLRGDVDQLDLSESTRLSGLWLDQNWPADSQIDGLHKLRQFAGGGPNLDDRILGHLLRCTELDELTVAYGALTAPALRSIAGLSHLTQLHLPGAAIDDDLVAAWSAMTRLRDVNFDDTNVGVETLRWLARQPSLRRLSLAGVDLRGPAGVALAELDQVGDLTLARCDVDPAILAQLATHGFLERLDVSGCARTDSAWERLSESRTLRVVTIGPPPPPELAARWLTQNEQLTLRWAAGSDPETARAYRRLLPEGLADRVEDHETPRRSRRPEMTEHRSVWWTPLAVR